MYRTNIKKITRKFSQTVLVILINLFVMACSSEQSAWEKAVDQNTISVFESFKMNFPNSKYNIEADKNIEELSWKEVVSINTSDSYELYLSKYPDGKYISFAVKKKEDALWTEIQKGTSYDKMIEFIANYPTSEYLNEVTARLEPRLWEEAIRANSYSMYKKYINKFPKGKNVIQAKDKMDDCYWKSMSRRKSNIAIQSFNILKYVKEFPDGKHKREAFKKIKANNKELKKVKIYTRNGCGRCEYAIRFLKQHDIEYTEYKTSNQQNARLMWNTIKRSNKQHRNSVTMPVIVYKNKCYFDIPNLKTRMKIIDYYYNMKKEDKAILNRLKKEVRGYY